MRPPSAHALDVLARHRTSFDQLVDLTAEHARAGDVEAVLRTATVAALHGWHAPHGRLADHRLERLVVDTARGGGRPVVDGTRTTGRVLHVLTTAYDTGGHTRLARRWIERDHRVTDLALVDQRVPAPADLLDTVLRSGGQVHDVGADHESRWDRAVALRGLMDQVDLVVLHVHPHDAVTLAAVNLPGPRPPVVLEDHADHAFWLGVGAADVVSQFRDHGRRLATELRGVQPERSVCLPIPVDVTTPATTGADLRARLGIPTTAVVALTVAAEPKLRPLGGRGMAHLLTKALSWCPTLVVVLVGAEPTGECGALRRSFPGRVVFPGPVTDPAPYYAAADVYLESYPTRSGTSVLEAAVAGVPVLALVDTPQDDRLAVYQAGSPGLDGTTTAADLTGFARRLRALVADPELRARVGAQVQASVGAQHTGPGWTAALEALYRHARASTAVDIDTVPAAVEDDRYGAALIGFMHVGEVREVDLVGAAVAAGLGDLVDRTLRHGLFALANRGVDAPLVVRVPTGWEMTTAWTTRLLALGADHPRLSVSFPFVTGDDAAGARSAAVLTELLADLGLTPDSCGDIAVEGALPRGGDRRVDGDLPLTDRALDDLEALLTSPGWGATAPAPATTAAGPHGARTPVSVAS